MYRCLLDLSRYPLCRDRQREQHELVDRTRGLDLAERVRSQFLDPVGQTAAELAGKIVLDAGGKVDEVLGWCRGAGFDDVWLTSEGRRSFGVCGRLGPAQGDSRKPLVGSMVSAEQGRAA